MPKTSRKYGIQVRLVASYLKAIHQAGRRMAREGLRTRKELGSWDMVLDYCRAELGHLTRESFHVLFLDQKNGLLTAKEQSRGTVTRPQSIRAKS